MTGAKNDRMASLVNWFDTHLTNEVTSSSRAAGHACSHYSLFIYFPSGPSIYLRKPQSALMWIVARGLTPHLVRSYGLKNVGCDKIPLFYHTGSQCRLGQTVFLLSSEGGFQFLYVQWPGHIQTLKLCLFFVLPTEPAHFYFLSHIRLLTSTTWKWRISPTTPINSYHLCDFVIVRRWQ